MVRVLFLFLTRFQVNVARSNGNQQGAKIFRQKLTHAYYAFGSDVKDAKVIYTKFFSF